MLELRTSNYSVAIRLIAGIVAVATTMLSPVAAQVLVRGVVETIDHDPIKSANVTLHREGEALGTATTDAKGRWSLLDVPPGRWSITVSATGFVASNGQISVPAAGQSLEISVVLRSLDVVLPRTTEGNVGTLIEWLERADSLVSQARFAEAREDYERAVCAAPLSKVPSILQALAYTHYKEGDPKRSLAVLRHGLAVAPRDQTLRQLYAMVAESVDDAGPVDDNAAEPEGKKHIEEAFCPSRPTRQPPPDVFGDRVEPEQNRNGRYQVAFAGSTRWADEATVAKRLFGDSIRDRDVGSWNPTQTTYEVYVPDRCTKEVNCGLLVWISPTSTGSPKATASLERLDRTNLIWVSANDGGNPRATTIRAAMALTAHDRMIDLYEIDSDRVFIGGYSGGARVAHAVALRFSELFRGALLLSGVAFYEPVPLPHRPGASWPAFVPRPPEDQMKVLRSQRSFAFVTGTRDFNRIQVRTVYDHLVTEGFELLELIEVPGATHYDWKGDDWFETGIAALGDSSRRDLER